MPLRLLARLVSVSPASPEKTSSDASDNCHNASELCSPGTISVRAPISSPRALTSGSARSIGVPSVGDTVAVTPRASLLWKPSP